LPSAQRAKFVWLPDELRWLIQQIRPFLALHLWSFLCMTAASLLALLTPLVLKWMIDQVLPQRNPGLLLLAVLLVFFGYQGKTVLMSAGNYLMLSAAQRLGLRLRMALLRHVDTLSANYYDETPVGTVMYPFQEPVDEVSYFGSDLLPAILRSVLTTGITVATMLTLSPALTFVVVPLIPAFLVARQYFRQRLTIDADRVQVDRESWTQFLEEHLSSIVSTQLLGQLRRQERVAFRRLARSVRSQQGLFRSGVWFTIATSLAVVLSMCAVIGYGGFKVIAGTLSVGGLVAFYTFTSQLFEPLSGAAELYARAQKTFASIRQVRATLRLKPSVVNAPASIPLSWQHLSRIEFAGVEFGYPRQKNMLHIPSLRVLAGEKVAIVGDNGAGKSTLGKLMARIYDVDAGQISIGGEDIRRIELESLRRHVAYLPHDPVLFGGTLASNLEFVRPGASERELQDVIHVVGLSPLVASLPEGIHQRIGPGACQLSGGQRQRLALARALVQQPRILILDEATSCLDLSSEGELFESIGRVLSHSILIVISHRLSTLASFQRVLVLSRGRVVEDGEPRSLLVAGSSYF
jgi:ABC-type multidrug transport system fused ATPase/permease subunit